MKTLNTSLWFLYFMLWIAVMSLFFSCNKNDDGKDEKEVDRSAMLIDLSRELILPAYDTVLYRSIALQLSVNDFTGTPDSAKLIALRNQLTAAHEGWQAVSLYEFGPAMDFSLKSNVNVYPADTARIEENILNGNTNLDILQNKAAKGFPAMDYLLFGKNVPATIAAFTNGPNAGNRKAYLEAIAADIKERIKAVQEAWNPLAGNYYITFINQKGTDVGSSLGMLVNAFNQHYERHFLDAKIGIPAGVRSAGIPRPAETEAYYQGNSVELAIANFDAIENTYLGKNKAGEDKLGLSDLLVGVDAADLDNRIKQQLKLARTQLESLQDPLSATIANDEAPALTAYQELKKLVVLFKSEMPSRLGVLITYQDNDGD